LKIFIGALEAAARHSGAGGGASAQAIGQSSAEQREIFCIGGSAGIGKRSHMVGQNDKRREPALAEEKCREETQPTLFRNIRRFAQLYILARSC
jgi:hypothetical protein